MDPASLPAGLARVNHTPLGLALAKLKAAAANVLPNALVSRIARAD